VTQVIHDGEGTALNLPTFVTMPPTQRPPRWKFAVVVWLAIYPLVTLFFGLFGNHLMAIHPLPIRTLVITLVLVPLMVFGLIPLLQRVLHKWLTK
jgi:antibiotic biosynthesis monooxygenase (ABM) superfamily enzyme